MRHASLAVAAILIAFAGTTIGSARAADYPVPSPYPVSWQLDFAHGKPTRIAVDTPGSTIPQAYWYMTYTVTNDGDREQRFYPEVDLVTADGIVHAADQNVPKRVYDQIRGAERNAQLESFLTINGPVRLGPAEARQGVAVWPETKLRMDHFQVYVTGLSGEAVTLKRGDDGKLAKATTAEQIADRDKNPSALTTLRKTLQLNFYIRGDDVYPGEDPVNTEAQQWIMR